MAITYPLTSTSNTNSPYTSGVKGYTTQAPGDATRYIPTANLTTLLGGMADTGLGTNPTSTQFYNSPYASSGKTLIDALSAMIGRQGGSTPYESARSASTGVSMAQGEQGRLMSMLTQMEPARLGQLLQVLQSVYGDTGAEFGQRLSQNAQIQNLSTSGQSASDNMLDQVPIIGGLLGGL